VCTFDNIRRHQADQHARSPAAIRRRPPPLTQSSPGRSLLLPSMAEPNKLFVSNLAPGLRFLHIIFLPIVSPKRDIFTHIFKYRDYSFFFKRIQKFFLLCSVSNGEFSNPRSVSFPVLNSQVGKNGKWAPISSIVVQKPSRDPRRHLDRAVLLRPPCGQEVGTPNAGSRTR